MTEANTEEINPASQRHWMYGLNVILLVIIGIAVLIFLMVMADKTRGRAETDWSSNGINSLSGSTKSLLQEINKGSQDFQILSLFIDPSDEAKRNGDPDKQAEKRRQVLDLLQLYKRGNTHIQVEDSGDASRESIVQRIRDKYKTELKPYEDAVEAFDPLAKKLSDFMKKESASIAANVQKQNASPDEIEAAASMQAMFRELPDRIDDMQRSIHRQRDEALPQWSDLTKDISGSIDKIAPMISLLADPVKLKETDLPKPLVAYFTSAAARYKSMADDLKAYQDMVAKLGTLKVQDVLTGLGRNTLVVLGPDSAKVLTPDKIFQSPNTQQDTVGPTPVVFKGEEAISSALLNMSRPEKIKVVFVSTNPQHLLEDMYSDMAEVLRQNNCEVMEWAPPAQPQPGQPPPEDQKPDPPAEGKGVVWVVFPGDANPQQMMMAMPNNAPLVAAISKHISAGGPALFFAEPSSSNSSPFGDLSGGGGYPFDSLVKPFGINVQSKFTAVHMMEGEDRATGAHVAQIAPYIDLSTYEDHEITRPVEAADLASAFFPANGVTVVGVQSSLPAGISAQVLIKTPFNADYWGEANFARDAKFDNGTDLVGPVPLAVVATKNKGQKDAEQRIMVVGTKYFGANPVLEAVQPAIRGNQLIQIQLFPGNEELMRNSILWLAGYDNMIAVSTKANASVRIGNVTPGTLSFIRAAVLVGAPLLALVLGASIWFLRRR